MAAEHYNDYRGLIGEDDLRVIAETVQGLHERELRGFSPPKEPSASPPDREHRFVLEATSLEDLISLILEAIPARSSSAYEGTRWEYEFEFRGVHCHLRSAKSGMKLRVRGAGHSAEELKDLQNEVERRLTRAAKSLYVRAIRPLVLRGLASNRAQVVNQYGRYRGMVDYFLGELRRLQTAAPLEATTVWDVDAPHSAIQNAAQAMLDGVRHDQEIAYLCTAFLSAYFSYVQHACVILSAFSDRALEEAFSLQDLLRAAWAEQFDAAFSEPRGAAIERAKTELGYLAKKHRNRLLHGGGGHPSDGVIVEWAPERHAVVTEDGEPTAQFMLWQASLAPHEIEDIIGRVAAVDAAIESHPFFPWLREGLPADFRPNTVWRARQALSMGRADAYVRAADGAYQRELNWD